MPGAIRDQVAKAGKEPGQEIPVAVEIEQHWMAGLCRHDARR